MLAYNLIHGCGILLISLPHPNMVAKEKTQSPDSMIYNQQHFLGNLDSGALSTVSHNINDNNGGANIIRTLIETKKQ